jgi:hypothetical protein
MSLFWNFQTALPQAVWLLLLLLLLLLLVMVRALPAALSVMLTFVFRTALCLAAAMLRALLVVQALAAWTPSVSPLMPSAAAKAHTILAVTFAQLLLLL